MHDIFISHASEDKAAVARPLAELLRRRGCDVWFDESSLRLGDSLVQEINRGLLNSRFGVVILSPDFLKKPWPQRELDGLFARETAETGKRILPVLHHLGPDEVASFSPILAGRVSVSTVNGLEPVVEAVIRALEDSPATGPHPTPLRPRVVERARNLADRYRGEAAREQFLASESGVRKAREEVSVLLTKLADTISEIRNIPELTDIRSLRDNDSIIVSSIVSSFSVAWIQQFANTLRLSALYVQEYDGRDPDRRLLFQGPPGVLADEWRYKFMVDQSGQPCWTEEDGDGTCISSDELADRLIHRLIDRLESGE